MKSILEYVVAGDLDARGLAFHALLAKDQLAWHPLDRVSADLHISYTWGLALSAQLETLGLAITRATGTQVHVRLSSREGAKQPTPITRYQAVENPITQAAALPVLYPGGRPSDVLRVLVERMSPGRVAGSRQSARRQPVTSVHDSQRGCSAKRVFCGDGAEAPANGNSQDTVQAAQPTVAAAPGGLRERTIPAEWVLCRAGAEVPANGNSQDAARLIANSYSRVATEPLALNDERAPLARARSSGTPEEEVLNSSSSGIFRKGEREGDRLARAQWQRANWLLRQRVCQEAIARTGAIPEQIDQAVRLYFADPRVARGEIECPAYLLRSKIEIVTSRARSLGDAELCRKSQAAAGRAREAELLEEHARVNAHMSISCLAQQLRDLVGGFKYYHPGEDNLMTLARQYGTGEEPVSQSPDEIRAQIWAMLRKAS